MVKDSGRHLSSGARETYIHLFLLTRAISAYRHGDASSDTTSVIGCSHVSLQPYVEESNIMRQSKLNPNYTIMRSNLPVKQLKPRGRGYKEYPLDELAIGEFVEITDKTANACRKAASRYSGHNKKFHFQTIDKEHNVYRIHRIF